MRLENNYEKVTGIQDWFGNLGLTVDYRTAERFTEVIKTLGSVYEKPSMFVEKTAYGDEMDLDGTSCSVRVPVSSFCKHHILPWIGWAEISYTPRGLVLGLSKFKRLVDWATHGLTLQEEATLVIGRELTEALGSNTDVEVIVRAVHTCAVARGVKAEPDFEYVTYYSNVADKY